MSDPANLFSAVAAAARDWSDPEYEPRASAVERTLNARNAFTEEALAFAVNQQMSLLTEEELRKWLRGRTAAEPLPVGVLNAGNVPLVELQDFLAVTLAGHRYLGTLSSKSPELLRAFSEDIRRREPSLKAAFVSADDLFRSAEAIMATGSDETANWAAERCREQGIGEENVLLRGSGFAAAVLDGRETEDDLEHLAEDVLLHEGLGCRNVALIWAPTGLPPDALLEAFAHFRGVFPAHPATSGRLKMQRAFLAAVNSPHAHGEGLEFLLSKGDPEVQIPGHVRWSEYDSIDEVNAWIENNRQHLQLVTSRPDVADRLTKAVEIVPLGTAQRPRLTWCPGGRDTIDFLCRVRRSVNRRPETS